MGRPLPLAFAALPESFGELTALGDLGGVDYQLAALHESFGGHAALRELDLGSGRHAALPGLVTHSATSSSQVAPCQPGAQVQVKSAPRSVQLPWTHCALAHQSIFVQAVVALPV